MVTLLSQIPIILKKRLKNTLSRINRNIYIVIKSLYNMEKEEARTIRVSQEVYDYIDTKAERASESFDKILRRLLNIK